MTTDDHILEVVQAHKDGKKIECMSDLHPDWTDCTANPDWNFAYRSYRKAAEPIEVELVYKGSGVWRERPCEMGISESYIRFREVIE